MLTELIFGIQKAKIGIVQFDAMLTETHMNEAEVTDHPVELGSDVTDNVKMHPRSIELNGLISNTPIEFLASITAPSPLDMSPGPPMQSYDRTGDAYGELLRMMSYNAGIVPVSTTLESYDNMAITSCVIHRDAENGNVLNATLRLREIKKVSPAQYSLDLLAGAPVTAANRTATNAGNKAKQTANDAQSEEAQKSLLASMVL